MNQLTPAFKVTPRDQEIIALALTGIQTAEIAKELRISTRSVKQHFRMLYLRAGITGGRKQVELLNCFPVEPSAKLERVPRLTTKQRAITEEVAEARTNKQIAAKLGSTEQVVKNHLRDIFNICGVWTRCELALWWKAHRAEFQ